MVIFFISLIHLFGEIRGNNAFRSWSILNNVFLSPFRTLYPHNDNQLKSFEGDVVRDSFLPSQVELMEIHEIDCKLLTHIFSNYLKMFALFSIGGLLCNVVLVCAIQQHESATSTHMFSPLNPFERLQSTGLYGEYSNLNSMFKNLILKLWLLVYFMSCISSICN